MPVFILATVLGSSIAAADPILLVCSDSTFHYEELSFDVREDGVEVVLAAQRVSIMAFDPAHPESPDIARTRYPLKGTLFMHFPPDTCSLKEKREQLTSIHCESEAARMFLEFSASNLGEPAVVIEELPVKNLAASWQTNRKEDPTFTLQAERLYEETPPFAKTVVLPTCIYSVDREAVPNRYRVPEFPERIRDYIAK